MRKSSNWPNTLRRRKDRNRNLKPAVAVVGKGETMSLDRRRFLQLAAGAALGLTAAAGCTTLNLAKKKARVVVIGGGYGGATAAKYLRMWDDGIEVILLERNSVFISCP